MMETVHRKKRYRIGPAERRHYDRLESLGLLALADEALTLRANELARRVEELADRGHLADFLELAYELEQQNDLMAENLADDDPGQAASGRDQARFWRRLRSRISRRAARCAPNTRAPRCRTAPRGRRTPARSEGSASGGTTRAAGPRGESADLPLGARGIHSGAGEGRSERQGNHLAEEGRAALRDEAVRYFMGRTAPFTQRELEDLLQLTRFTLLRYRRQGVLRAFIRGNVVRYHVEDVYALLKSQTV